MIQPYLANWMHMEPRRGCRRVSGSHRGDSASQKDFGPRCGKGLKKRYSLIEKQLYATYHPLQAAASTWKLCCNGADHLSHLGVAV